MIRVFNRVCAVLGLLTVWCFPVLADDPSAVILMYHRFGESAFPSTSTTLEQLNDHITALQEGGHTVLPLDQVVAALQANTPLPDKAVAITVDDAYRSFLTDGWPRFKAAGFPVMLFVATAGVDADFADLLSWDDIRALQSEGVSIGAHSHGHGHYPALSAEDVEDDLEKMKSAFTRELGATSALFAFPYGEAGQADMAAVTKAGFTAAFGQHSGAAGVMSNPFYLPRFALNEAFGGADRFRLIINTLPLPVTNLEPNEPVLKDTLPAFALTLSSPPQNISALTCFGPGGAPLETAVDGDAVWITPVDAFPKGRVRLNCTLPVRRDGNQGRWYWFGWQMIAGFQSEGVAVHPRYR